MEHISSGDHQNVDNDYKEMLMEILEMDQSELAKELHDRLTKGLIDGETDILLRRLCDVQPYNFIIPPVREELGLTLGTDKECIDALRSLKIHITESNESIDTIDRIIRCISDPNGVLDEDIVPELDLMVLIEYVPMEMLPVILNCIDYINDIIHESDDESNSVTD